jgi:hypothetical protein
MEWKVPFVVYRITAEGKLEEVFLAEDFKAASYWLSYIAQPGDVLCKTPLHKKHSHGSAKAEYWSHKGDARELITNEQTWKQWCTQKQCAGEFPAEQEKERV